MALFTSPDAAAVRIESRLNKEQVSTTYANVAALEADIEVRIAQESVWADLKVGQRFPAVVAGDLTADELAMGTYIIQLRALASLYHAAGQLNEAYHVKAMDYERRANEWLELLLTSIGNHTATAATATGYATMRVGRGRYADADAEYTSLEGISVN